jgi:hypothetical protein
MSECFFQNLLLGFFKVIRQSGMAVGKSVAWVISFEVAWLLVW